MPMELRKYQSEDSSIICSWIKDEKSLYQWSANCIGKFPLTGNEMNDLYVSEMKCNKFIPLSAFDEEGNLVGHLRIRYPDEANSYVVRIGFVIIDPILRGNGNGKKMMQLAIDYAKNILNASKITLGVFSNNDCARHCYESVGFRSTGETEIYKMPIGEWECIEMELAIS